MNGFLAITADVRDLTELGIDRLDPPGSIQETTHGNAVHA